MSDLRAAGIDSRVSTALRLQEILILPNKVKEDLSMRETMQLVNHALLIHFHFHCHQLIATCESSLPRIFLQAA